MAFLHEHGKRVIYDAEHFFDGYADNSDYALRTLQAAAEGQAMDRIKELEQLGYEFQGAHASFELLLRTIRYEVPDVFAFDRMRVWSGQDDDGKQTVEASLALTVQGQRKPAVAEGNGPVDVLSNAVREALYPLYPQLESVHLSDYKVRVLTPQDGPAATVRVLIEHSDGIQI